MLNDSTPSSPRPPPSTPPPPDYEIFCIHSYAGEAGPPCGWRGLRAETQRDQAKNLRFCPRCGRATLMDILPPTTFAKNE